ncbi:hypothetical protein [Shewanella gelidii]|uniref:Uncharacterized protein n=1 Tax=Shewanella gelidii TaxID=1642821 RepID=A0A917JMW6_9GAMM|nr:hypothetical protein [Shewanella gelidii]MCL1097537.1 hypothetical protein [Shewanella gelidii]GGI76081.1 hypothetical protein GCM10009332_11820 [Shewanella gelidii]
MLISRIVPLSITQNWTIHPISYFYPIEIGLVKVKLAVNIVDSHQWQFRLEEGRRLRGLQAWPDIILRYNDKNLSLQSLMLECV